jgi:hypothetical protein
MDTFLHIGHVEYEPSQRQRFASGELRAEWFRNYPNLFDEDDFRRASNRSKPYFFYEWLGAILLHHSTGYSALVTKYQQDSRKRTLLPQILPSAVLNVLQDHTLFGKTQGPDLLMYNPSAGDWFFCECKGPGDELSEKQIGYFGSLVAASHSAIRLLRFRLLRAPKSPNRAPAVHGIYAASHEFNPPIRRDARARGR